MMRLLISILAIGLSGVIFFGYTKPAYDKAQEARALSAQYDEVLTKANELQQRKQTLQARLNTFNPADTERLQKLLPNHVDNVRLVLDLNNLAARYGLGLQNVNVSSADQSEAGTIVGQIGGQDAQAYDSLTLRFATAGTYGNFAAFLKDLELSLRIVDVESLSITQGSGSKLSEPNFQYNVTVRTYWLK